MADDLRHWLALLRAPGVGPVTFRRLLGHYGGPAALFADSPGHWEALGLSPQTRDWLHEPDRARVDEDLAWLEGERRHLLTLDDPRYPQRLRELPDAPPLLFVHGDPAILDDYQLAMVGSRNPTPGGQRTAFEFAHHLAAAGLVITSGMALGIDAAAHEGALAAEHGATVAVAGTGLDRVYPARHRELAHRITERGALISEFPPGTGPRAENFPRRNRIISGLALGVLVVEAAARSGSLITARQAGEQGREVFAIPGSIHNPLARGCHALIRQGAKLVETAGDVLEELRGVVDLSLAAAPEGAAEAPPAGRDEDHRRLLEALGWEAVPVDILVERTGLTAEAVSSILLLLELEGEVAGAPGGGYVRLAPAMPRR